VHKLVETAEKSPTNGGHPKIFISLDALSTEGSFYKIWHSAQYMGGS